MKINKNNALSVTSVLTGALVWGLIWYPYRALAGHGVDGPLATLFGYFFAVLAGTFLYPGVWRKLNVALLATGKSGTQKAGFPRLDVWLLCLVLSAGWANLGFVLGILYGEVMRVMLLFYLAPLWTILFSYWLLGESLNRYGYLVMALSVGGAVIMLWTPDMGLPLPQNMAEWIGLSAGMGFALSNVVSRGASHLDLETKAFSVLAGSAVLTLPVLLWQGGLPAQVQALDAFSWLLLVLIGITLCATGYAVQYGVTHLPANRAILLFLFELVTAAVSSYLIAGESMQLRDWASASLIVSASLMSGSLTSGRLYARETNKA